MLSAILKWSVAHPGIVLVATVGLSAAALTALPSLPLDAFPDTTPVQVQVNAFAPGLAPVEVERQVTVPVEQSLGARPRLAGLRSLSKFGLSQVVVTFEDGTDIYFARQQISERLAGLEVPAGVKPQLGPVATGLGEVFHYLVRAP